MRSRSQGLTLIELVICIVIILLLLTLGIPSMVDYFANAAIRDVADEMQASLQQAKFEAIRRNTSIVFASNGTQWTITLPGSGNNPATTITARAARGNEANLVLAPAQTTVTFTSTGNTTLPNNLSILLSKPTSGGCITGGGNIRCLQMNVSTMGQIRLCDPALPNTDPRGC